MLLVTRTDDGTDQTYMGISDFTLAEDGRPIIHWPRDINARDRQDLDGRVVRAAAIPVHNIPGLQEVIRDSSPITIALSDEFPLLCDAVRELRRESSSALADATILESR